MNIFPIPATFINVAADSTAAFSGEERMTIATQTVCEFDECSAPARVIRAGMALCIDCADGHADMMADLSIGRCELDGCRGDAETLREGRVMCFACAQRYDDSERASHAAMEKRLAEIIAAPGCGCAYDSGNVTLCAKHDQAALLTRTEIEDRCALIALHVLGFDPRAAEAPEIRTVDSRKLLGVLVLAYLSAQVGR